MSSPSSFLGGLQIYIFPAKIEASELNKLELTVPLHGGQIVHSPGEADLVLSRAKRKARMALSLPEEIFLTKPIIEDRWLKDCILHSSILDLASAESLPSPPPSSPISPSDPEPSSHPPVANQARTDATSGSKSASSSSPSSSALVLPTPSTFSPFRRTPTHLIPPPGCPMDPKTMSPLSVHRVSPLVCVNQRLLDELEVLIKWKEVGEDSTGDWDKVKEHKAQEYRRGCASIKAYPTKLISGKEAQKLPHVGQKIASLVEEFIENGYITLARAQRTNSRLHALLLFQTLHGVGPHLARELYDHHGCRNLDDVKRVRPNLAEEVDIWAEMQTKIPRSEVEEIGRFVSAELEKISPGCIYEICGGYRRGRLNSNDCDLIFTHPSSGASQRIDTEMLDKLVENLQKTGEYCGVLLNVLTGSHLTFGGGAPKSSQLVHQRLTILRLPGEGHIRRRVDLIFSQYESYWPCVIGWTGSTQRQAQSLDLKFHSTGITRQRDGALVKVDPRKGERGIFDALKIEWREPWERCADI
ncbi:hypothetical protein BDY24DRAFT_417563 [Mrakia frigida]|uniref:uncharacterized protein n=1 Tax=Mrakia frigida TaxID=29902 RepID=UPI003FCBF59E